MPDQFMDPEQYRRMTDDGLNSQYWQYAHAVLIGVGGTGKTTVAEELARMRVRAAVCPIVPYVDLPSELKGLDQHRLFALRMDQESLCNRRQKRAEKEFGPNYASWDQAQLEIDDARIKLMAYPKCRRVDVTRDGVITVANEIIRLLRVTYGDNALP